MTSTIAGAAPIDDTMLRTLTIYGTPAECAAGIHERFGGVASRVALTMSHSADASLTAEGRSTGIRSMSMGGGMGYAVSAATCTRSNIAPDPRANATAVSMASAETSEKSVATTIRLMDFGSMIEM